MNDLALIVQLQIEIEYNLSLNVKCAMGYSLNGYRLDKKDNVIGIYLAQRRLKKIPNTIFSFSKLKELELFDNHIHEIPPEISKLVNLTRLGLSHNLIQKIPPEISKLTKLKKLSLHDNRITTIPPEITNLNMEWRRNLDGGFIFHDNPIKSPPVEILNKGLAAVKIYFESLEEDQSTLNEVKVLLVGDGGAGKTSLTKAFLNETFNTNELTTHGIRIKKWDVKNDSKNMKVNIWDFGGQEVMHATHQFFLSKRSLYILVLDGRRDERPEYWLRHIESFGGDSPVLIILNKCDANPSFDINRPFLQKKYSEIKGFYRTSCATGQGIKKLKEALIKELAQVKLVETRWANSWFSVKQEIENLKKDYINYDEYETICREAGVTESYSQDVLVEFLNDLGVVVHFKQFELDDIHVLDPTWVTTAVYKIINSAVVSNNKGILKLKGLKEILSKQDNGRYIYPQDKYKYIIGLMKKFELCYELDTETILIPQLLDIVEPDFKFDFESSLKFILNYDDFLSPSIMPRFIVKIHKDIREKLIWRTGVVLENSGFETVAVVIADNEANQIQISVSGFQKKDYLAVILLFFREINDSFEKLKVNELIPMPDDSEITASYKTLVNYAKRGMDKYIPDCTDRVYNVEELLGLVQLDENKNFKQLLDILKRIDDKIEDRKSFDENVNRILDLKPNIAGIGINLNELYKLFKKQIRSKQ